MSSLKEALARVSRVVRQHDQLRQSRSPSILLPTEHVPSHKKRPVRARIPRKQLNETRPQLQDYLKKQYQRFLEPLEMPQLKIYDDHLPPYNESRAELNLANKTSTDQLQIFTNFLGERQTFDKMMALLVELTPPDLKDKTTVENSVSLARVLNREDEHFHSTRFNYPRYHFHEIPPIPSQLSKEKFHEYIYLLTHSKMLYRNSSSLMSGIVPEILLYTHRLDNEQFKPYRSVDTYNCLIKYFGYDKFQNSFARELLLVMVKDGHSPNINTINQLLKICRIHSKRRSLVSTYKVVINYLNLAKNFGLRINLATWNRIYDCIDNIFLKETFLNKISAVSLPVSNNLCIRILEDFCETTQNTDEVVSFLESDLRRPNWRNDPRMSEKIVYHKAKHLARNENLSSVFKLLSEISMDSLTLKALANAIHANVNLTQKAFLILCMYNQLSPRTETVPPEVYSRVIGLLCDNDHGYDISELCLLLRGVIHDATRMLKLPVETVIYEENNKIKKPRQSFPYKIPKAVFSENYRIMKRLSYKNLIMFEAKVIYANNNSKCSSKYPWEPLSQEEQVKWRSIVTKMKSQGKFWENSAQKANSVGFVKSTSEQAPAEVLASYDKLNSIQMRLSREISTVKKLHVGLDNHLENEMVERHIFREKVPK